MIDINNLEEMANEKLEENNKFRTFLKSHADPKELDDQFKQLHDKFFAIYDCSKCRNCCKKLTGTIPINEIKKDAEHLGISEEEFKNKYSQNIENSNKEQKYPCAFFDGKQCILHECRPEDCKNYPYTNQSDRLFRMWGVINQTFVCPVVYEIMQELKEIYNFR